MFECRKYRTLIFAPSETGRILRKGRMGAQLSTSLILGLALAASAQARYDITDEDAMGEGSPKVVVLHDTGAGSRSRYHAQLGAEISSFKVTRQGKIACKGIAVYTLSGKLIRTIEFPEAAVNCSSGDRDLQTLYVAARNSISKLRVPDKGWANY